MALRASPRLAWATLAAGLWWGSLTALCAVVVPLLFAHLPTAQLAGGMAARLFSAQTWLSAACALLLLMVFNRTEDETLQSLGRLLLRWVVAGFLFALLLELAVAPRILLARGDAQALRWWHGLGTALMLMQWLCASWVFWRLARRT
jgi:hypothetical protein